MKKYYRGVINTWFPTKGNKESLKTINLPADAGKSGTKYNLIELLKYKDKTVEELFQEAVHEHMSRTTFNSYSEMCSWASKVGLNLSEFSMVK